MADKTADNSNAATQEQAQQFASIDSMTLVGAHANNAELQPAVNQAVAPFIGQNLTGTNGTDVANDMTQKLIGLVEDMYAHKQQALNAKGDTQDIQQSMQRVLDHLDEAHQTIKAGTKQGITTSKEPIVETSQVAADNSAHLDTPSPVMTPEWIKQLGEKSGLALGA